MPRIRFETSPRACVLVLAALTCLGACKEEGGGPDDGKPPVAETARKELLSAVGACVQTNARTFQAAAVELESAAVALAASSESGKREAARMAFHRAMDAWQVLEAMQLGPAAPRSLPGGAELRDHIYSWPLVSRCAIEEQIVSRGYESPDFPTMLVTRRGLYAVEYLLFYEGGDTVCPASAPIVSGGTWAALSAEERQSRKYAYAAAAAREVQVRAGQLVDAWDPAKGNFVGTLETAGPDNAVYPSVQLALNSVSDALFYLEREVKDMKLARPLGLRECDAETCPEQLESRFAARSKANLRANLVGFRRVAEGCGEGFVGKGFDDLLEAVGSEPMAAKLRERLVATEAALAAVDEPDLAQALAQDKASVRAFYDALKAVTDVLKTELVTVLDLELPQSLEGDND
ncbi:imelysin family protein [Hyalangium sp.]|uniref:imelysin family protein n=1 Tax=Hyalangium sp. TaxID=2028555 RepID=UPI002D6CA3D5|nr:imelysin family protein [Hyalangium sp.]HYH98486.1 imelysin family protein [Hyalangium sp.]